MFHTPIAYNIYLPTTATNSQDYIYYASAELDRTNELPSTGYPIFAQDCHHGTWRVRKAPRTGIWRPIPALVPRNLDFQTYLAGLDPWEADLLHFVQLKADVFNIMRKILPGFSAASNGSVLYKTNGSFGWILATNSDERLAEAYGPVRGYRPTSYRAEAYGLLSVLRFIKRIHDYCNTTADTRTWTVTSDNLSLVDIINDTADDESKPLGLHDWTNWDTGKVDIDDGDLASTNTFANGLPNPTLEPDWDVLHEIKWTLHQQLQGGKLIHTKGHQDDKQKYATLSLLAQLNVDADKLAGLYQDRHRAAHPTVLLFPHTAAQVHIPEGTITSRLPFTLRLVEHGPPLRNYIRTKNQWTKAEFDYINWDSHAAVIKAHNTRMQTKARR